MFTAPSSFIPRISKSQVTLKYCQLNNYLNHLVTLVDIIINVAFFKIIWPIQDISKHCEFSKCNSLCTCQQRFCWALAHLKLHQLQISIFEVGTLKTTQDTLGNQRWYFSTIVSRNNIWYTQVQLSRFVRIDNTKKVFSCSCLNPILYAFLSDNFRKAFHNLMPCCMKMGGGPTHPGHHALRYELTTMKSSTRGRRSLRDIRRRKPKKCLENGVSTTNDLRTGGTDGFDGGTSACLGEAQQPPM